MPIRKEESRTKRILLTLVVLFVLFSSIIGFTYSSISFGISGNRQASPKYGGFQFFQTDNGIATQIGSQFFEFTHYPDELSDTDASAVTSRIASSRMSYITSHPNSSISSEISGLQFDISRALAIKSSSYVEVAFTSGNPYGKKTITCSDATPLVPVIFINFTNTTTEIAEDGNCVNVNAGSVNSFNRVHDRIVYELLGVLP